MNLSKEKITLVKKITALVMAFILLFTGINFNDLLVAKAENEGWNFALKYVNEPSPYYTEKKDDFTLKYMFQFDSNTSFDIGDVNIKLNASLFKLRDGSSVMPYQVGVPEGGIDEKGNYIIVPSKKSSFDYYISEENVLDEDGNPVLDSNGNPVKESYIIFYNYKPISSGDQNIVEVMYNTISCFDVYDDQTWQIDCDVAVNKKVVDSVGEPVLDEDGNQTFEEERISTYDDDFSPLTGKIDTEVNLTSTTKAVFKDSSLSYTPGLYTVDQVKRYIGSIDDPKFINADGTLNTGEYIFVVWKSTVKGTCNQPWSLYLDDIADANNGEIVGVAADRNGKLIKGKKKTLYVEVGGTSNYLYYTEPGDGRTERSVYYAAGTDKSNELYQTYGLEKQKNFEVSYYIVTAYNKNDLPGFTEGKEYVLTNEIEAVLQGADHPQVLKYAGSADLVGKGDDYAANDAQATWNPYKWLYKGDTASITKKATGKTDLYAILDTNYKSKAETGLWGQFGYTVSADVTGYGATHYETYKGNYETYTGGYNHIVAADDLIYIRDYSKLAGATMPTYGIVSMTEAADNADGTGVSSYKLLTEDDYYYSNIKLSITDKGYDVWEDRSDLKYTTDEVISKVNENATEKFGVDWNRNWNIYYIDDTSTEEWKLLDTITWEDYLAKRDTSGVYNYSIDFNKLEKQELADKIVRIKVSHDTVDYSSSINMTYNVNVRATSPIFNALYDELHKTEGEGDDKKDKYDGETGSTYSTELLNTAALIASEHVNNNVYYNPTTGQFLVNPISVPTGFKLVAGKNASISKGAKPSTYSGTSPENMISNFDASVANIKSKTDTLYASDKVTSNGANTEAIRAAAKYNLYDKEKKARAFKASSAYSDSTTGRINVIYKLAAYEGYKVYAESAKNYLVEDGLTIPRKTVEFYDLLPYKMSYDGSVTPTVARIKSTTDHLVLNSQSNWDESQVQLVDTKITENYKGTGRTLVKFVLEYTGADETLYDVNNNLWYAGYAVSFGSYVSWSDYDDAESQYNICAYMPGGDESKDSVIGTKGEVSQDNGTSYPTAYIDAAHWQNQYCFFDVESNSYKPYFGGDINGDDDYSTFNVLYASDHATGDFATASKTGITKTVKADADETLAFESFANVGYGDNYTYDITLSNASDTALSNIVIFDKLENTLDDQYYDKLDTLAAPGNISHDKSLSTDPSIYWQGKFKEIDIASLVNNRKILVKVYYSENSNAKFPTDVSKFGTVTGSDVSVNVLNGKKISDIEGGDWKELIIYDINSGKTGITNTVNHIADETVDLSKIKAIAVDLRTAYTEDYSTTDFELSAGSSVNFRYRMTSPEAEKFGDGTEFGSAVYTYNNPYYYSCIEGSTAANNKYVLYPGNITAVKIGKTETLEIEKTINEEQFSKLSESLKNKEFTFHILNDEGNSCIDKKYQVWEKVPSGYVAEPGEKVENGYKLLDAGQYITVGSDSNIKLKTNQKAVFEGVRDASKYTVTEITGIEWEYVDDEYGLDAAGEKTDIAADREKYVHNFKNTYQPIVYIKKTTTGVPASVDTSDPANITFTYIVKDKNGNPIEDVHYYYVKSAAAATPVVVEVGGVTGGVTNSDGEVSFPADQIVALLLPEQLGEQISIVEKLEEDSVWICNATNNTVSKTVENTNTTASFENIYKNKDLYINKEITHSEFLTASELADYTFYFKLYREDLTTGEDTLVPAAELRTLEMIATSVSGDVITDTTSSVKIFDDGTVAAKIGGGSLCIKEIAGLVVKNGKTERYSYTVKEVSGVDGDDTEKLSRDFAIVEGTDSITMSLKGKRGDLNLVNDCRIRDLAITKQVAAKELPSKDYKFTLRLTDADGNALANKTFRSSFEERTNLTTDANGKFTISANETITFDKIGIVGDEFYIYETIDNTYMPLSLDYESGAVETKAGLIRLEDSGESLVKFEVLNGGKDYIVLRKNYIGLDDVAKKHIKELTADDELSKLLDIKATLYIKGTDGNFYEINTYTISGKKGYEVVNITEEIDKLYAEKGFSVPDGDYSKVSYKVVEQSVMPKLPNGEITNDAGDTLGVTYTISPEVSETTGKAYKDQLAILINDVDAMQHRSIVYKYNYLENPDYGDTMKWVVQEYDGKSWVPKEGVRYQVYDGKGSSRSDVLTTSKNGEISIKYYESGDIYSAYVVFEQEDIFVNVVNPTVGDLRVIETDMSLDGFGYLFGYGTNSKIESEILSIKNAEKMYTDENGDVFINSLETEYLEIEKKVEGQIVDNTVFGFNLSTVLTGETLLGSGFDYTVYSRETDQKLRDGLTDKDGNVYLMQGEYAKVRVPKYIKWTIEENKVRHWDLTKIETNSDKVAADVKVDEHTESVDITIGEMQVISEPGIYEFPFKGEVQTFVAPESGYYRLEAWGAQGYGKNNSEQTHDNYMGTGGKGAYTTGEVFLKKGDTIYVYVGGTPEPSEEYLAITGKGTKYSTPGGFNGGGDGTYGNTTEANANPQMSFAGGGATDFRLVASTEADGWSGNDSLKSRIMVAAGGGGAAGSGPGGSGGALNGINGYDTYDATSASNAGYHGNGATQKTGGTVVGNYNVAANIGTFGKGGSGADNFGGNGGGGGYYGGGGSTRNHGGGGGGSSYIKGYTGCDTTYTGSQGDYEFINTEMIPGVSYSGKGANGIAPIDKGYEMIQPDGTYNNGHEGNGYARITKIDAPWGNYEYTGSVQTFEAPESGYYLLEAWGAQGGGSLANNVPKENETGFGAYTSGYIYLKKNEIIYIYVGGQGSSPEEGQRTNAPGGWNGGGYGTWDNNDDEVAGGGGGATDFRFVDGEWNDNTSLTSRVMVAGAGGGRSWYVATSYGFAGYGGTVENVGNATCSNGSISAYGGTQTAEYGHMLGQGQNGEGNNDSNGIGGGGGGYYGGSHGYSDANGSITSVKKGADCGAGGSSYINGYPGCDTTYADAMHPIVNGIMIAGNENMIQPDGTYSVGHKGDGYARVTKVEMTSFEYTGDVQKFEAPKSGLYLFEAWGAQGGAADKNIVDFPGGMGGYTSGYTYLEAGQTIYVYVGGKGADGTSSVDYAAGGYNGGGKGAHGYGTGTGENPNSGGGGGATDFRLINGEWNNQQSLASRIMVAGAGSGGGSWKSMKTSKSNAAGGLEGYGNRTGYTATPGTTTALAASGGTQTGPGIIGGTSSTGHPGKQDGLGKNGGFGYGGDACINHGSGAGGGYYGGGGGGWENQNVYAGGGGSSFISGYTGCNAIASSAPNADGQYIHTGQPVHYSGIKFFDSVMKSGADSMKQPDGTTSTGHSGDGFARISFVGEIGGPLYESLSYLESVGTAGSYVNLGFSFFDGPDGSYSDANYPRYSLACTFEGAASQKAGSQWCAVINPEWTNEANQGENSDIYRILYNPGNGYAKGLYLYANTKTNGSLGTVSANAQDKFTVKLSSGRYEVENLTTGAKSENTGSAGANPKNPNTVMIFNNRIRASGDASYAGKIYSVDIYYDEELIHSFKPVKRTIDNKYGMYDEITGYFHEATGNITGGV